MYDRKPSLSITVDGVPLPFRPGQTIAQVMMASGRTVCRTAPDGNPRGFFCGMGVCGECRMIVNGSPNTRTCQTPAEGGMVVCHQDDRCIGQTP